MQAYWFVHYCISMAENIINKGIHCFVKAHGNALQEGKSYTCTLYYSPKKEEYRASDTRVAEKIDDVILCNFVFTPEQTAQLKRGECILEIYDTESLQQMLYIEDYAEVRSTSLSV